MLFRSEDKEYMPSGSNGWLEPHEIQQMWPLKETPDTWERYKLVTKPEVIHAEMNAIAKVAKHGDSCDGASMFLTHAPCVECAKMICQSGIKVVYYKETYRSIAGIELLIKSGVEVKQA